ncbi:MAG: adenylate/guanylate cyclase domain-containing protein [Alphaproteobacteria bacterium]|nr:adenylate/guanylate cyclase domain-containing protein [Alphaproteobacteria bacterium]
MDQSTAELTTWLAEAGLGNMPLEEMVDGFSRRLNRMGISIARTFVGTNTLHPMVSVRSMVWTRPSGPSERWEFDHVSVNDRIVQQSPFVRMLREGIAEERRMLTDAAELSEPPVFEELRAAGMTEWLGRVFSFGELSPRFRGSNQAERIDRLWLACSLSTDRPGGYGADELAVLKLVLPVFAVAVKAATMRGVGHGLLATYLGRDPAERVLSGTILRGEVQNVRAVLLYADLRGFTQMAGVTADRELIAMLDDYFDCMVRPVMRRGGEILKFLGDGLLAAFAADSEDVGSAALDAAEEALSLVESLNAGRHAANQPIMALDVALHVGDVLYGNVGIDARLDFTVIGPAVNEASRIEFMCKSVDRNLLASGQFIEAAPRCRSRLVSIGRHRLRGVREEAELFGLASSR